MKKSRISARRARDILDMFTICEECQAVYRSTRKRCKFCGAKKTGPHVCTCDQCDCGEPY